MLACAVSRIGLHDDEDLTCPHTLYSSAAYYDGSEEKPGKGVRHRLRRGNAITQSSPPTKGDTTTESSGWGQTRDSALSYRFVQGSCAVQNTQSLSRPIVLGAQVEGSSTATRQKIAKHPTALQLKVTQS